MKFETISGLIESYQEDTAIYNKQIKEDCNVV